MRDDEFIYGDSEPEDAFDANDPVDVQADNVRRRLEAAADDLARLVTRIRHGR